MTPNINQTTLNTVVRVLSNQVKTLASQGYEQMYFTAQFSSSGKKQNGIERGDVLKISRQVRNYIKSEQADTVYVEIYDDSSDKSIYRKKFTGLCDNVLTQQENVAEPQPVSGFSGFGSLGEVEFNALVDRRVEAKEQEKEVVRMRNELEDLRGRYASLEAENAELEDTLSAKKQTEYYMGIIGAAFPGLASLFQGTPLATAAGMLAGTTDLNGNPIVTAKATDNSEVQSIATMVSEFCNTLNPKEAGMIHMLFAAFEKDKAQIQRAVQFISTQTPSTNS